MLSYEILWRAKQSKPLTHSSGRENGAYIICADGFSDWPGHCNDSVYPKKHT
jgi:hypothetical protein